MRIVKPSVEFYGAVPTDYDSALKFIELAGRLCYKSEDKITDTSAEGFVRRLIKAGHLAMVEHSNFVVKTSAFVHNHSEVIAAAGKYLQVVTNGEDMWVGGNLTAWVTQGVERCFPAMFQPFLRVYGELFNMHRWIRYQKEWQVCPHDEIPKELHRYSAKFICDRGVSHELVRHRPCSFAQESTRYCNYSGKDMEFIEPEGYTAWPISCQVQFEVRCSTAEFSYGEMLAAGLKPQQARAVLPNALKTEIVVTADAAEWAHIRKLRTVPAAHPDMRRVMNMVPWESFL